MPEPTSELGTLAPFAEFYDVQPRTVEVGGEIVVTGRCADKSDNAWVRNDIFDESRTGWLHVPITREHWSAEGAGWGFEVAIRLGAVVSPGPMTLYPECLSVEDEGNPRQSSVQPGYEPITIEVTEIADGPAWASYKPIAFDVQPTVIEPGGSVQVTATCPADATAGNGRIFVIGPRNQIAPYLGQLYDTVEVPTEAYTTDGDTNSFTVQVSLAAVPPEASHAEVHVSCTATTGEGLPGGDEQVFTNVQW